MWKNVHTTELIVFAILFIAVSAMGFVAARWRRIGADFASPWNDGEW